MNHEVRRKDRELDGEEARLLLERGEYGILSTCDPDGHPYGIPLNYCLLNDAIYFHCAVEGHKLDNIAADSRVSFCVVGETEVLPEQFATRYESVVVSGRASEVFDGEKQLVLEGLLAKYSAPFRTEGLIYIKTMEERTRLFRIAIDIIHCKARR